MARGSVGSILQAESTPESAEIRDAINAARRFGDPYVHVHYEATALDHEPIALGANSSTDLWPPRAADEGKFASTKYFTSGHHHMGTCRMGHGVRDSVVDQFGKIYGTPNLFVVGGSNFVSPSAVNPTLTMVALAIRTTEYIVDRLL